MQTLILFNYFKLLLLKLTLFYPKKTSYFRLEFFVMSGLMHYSSLTQKQPPSFTKISSNHEEVQKMEDQQSYSFLEIHKYYKKKLNCDFRFFLSLFESKQSYRLDEKFGKPDEHSSEKHIQVTKTYFIQ